MKVNRRKMLQAAGASMGTVAMVTLSGCLGDENGDDEGTTSETTQLPYLLTESAVDMVPFQVGQERGIFADHGIEINLEITTYGEYSRGLTTGDSNLGNADQSMFVDAYVDDFRQLAFGSNLLQFNSMFVREGSDIESPADIEGRSVAFPGFESGTALGMRSVIEDEFGFDPVEDTDSTAVDSAVAYQLVVDGEVDAAILFTGDTIRGFADDDLRSVFNIWEAWEERTGYPLDVIYFAAREEWLEDNWDVAYEFTQAWEESLEAVAEDPEDAYGRLGQLAGLTDEDQAEVAVNAFESGDLHQMDQSVWDEEYLDAQWEFLELLETYGLKEEAPPRDQLITHQELAENAEEM